MDRPALVRAELERVKSEARAVEAAGPPCRDCRYITLTGSCSNPAYYKQEFEPSSGRYKVRCDTPVSTARSEGGLCGPEALLWEPQNKVGAVLNGVGRQMEAHPFLCAASVVGLLLLL
jgi:hypothetical protein